MFGVTGTILLFSAVKLGGYTRGRWTECSLLFKHFALLYTLFSGSLRNHTTYFKLLTNLQPYLILNVYLLWCYQGTASVTLPLLYRRLAGSGVSMGSVVQRSVLLCRNQGPLCPSPYTKSSGVRVSGLGADFLFYLRFTDFRDMQSTKDYFSFPVRTSE
jgi:hypothetical protein